jgi:zinc transporter ZupT
MYQIFYDHGPYIAGALLIAIVLVMVPQQTRWTTRISRVFLMLAGIYPIVITWLFLARNSMGESYAYLIYGLLIAALLGLLGGALLLSFIIVYVTEMQKTNKRTSNQAL